MMDKANKKHEKSIQIKTCKNYTYSGFYNTAYDFKIMDDILIV